jgi:hypothetical protein
MSANPFGPLDYPNSGAQALDLPIDPRQPLAHCTGPRIIDSTTPARECSDFARRVLTGQNPDTLAAFDRRFEMPTAGNEARTIDEMAESSVSTVFSEGRCEITVSSELPTAQLPWVALQRAAVRLVLECVETQHRVVGLVMAPADDDDQHAALVEVRLNTGPDQRWREIMDGRDARPEWVSDRHWLTTRLERANLYRRYLYLTDEQALGRAEFP